MPVVVPYYNKPTQEARIPFPQDRRDGRSADILYNVPAPHRRRPARTTRHAPGAPGHHRHQGTDRQHRARHRLIKCAPRNFAIYSGEDCHALALILLGGHGVISSPPTWRRADAPDVRGRPLVAT